MTQAQLDEIFTVCKLTDEQREAIARVFRAARVFADEINSICPESREKSVALSHVQTAVLFADAAIGIHGVAEERDE